MNQCPSKEAKKTSCLMKTFKIGYGDYISHYDRKYVYSSGNWQQGLSAHNDGAYLFRTDSEDFPYGGPITSISYFVGSIVSEIRIIRQDIQTTIRLFKNRIDLGIQINSFVGPIDNSKDGRNIIIRVKTEDIENGHIFETDQNGLSMVKRVFGGRYTFEPTFVERTNISGNYYPITSAIRIKDLVTNDMMMYSDSVHLLTSSLMTDRAQGASSLRNGEIEVMIHRRLICDDERGVEEVLNERDGNGQGLSVMTTHHLLFANAGKK